MEQDSKPGIWIETTSISGPFSKQIAPRSNVAELLESRKDDLNAAVNAISNSIGETLHGLVEPRNWKIDTFEAQVGINLAVEAGVMIMKGSSNATICLTITYARNEPGIG